MKALVLLLLSFYQKWLSPILGGRCRFWPSCSHYAQESFETHNFFFATWLSLRRLSRCQPWGAWGYDPVPAVATGSTTASKSSARANCSADNLDSSCKKSTEASASTAPSCELGDHLEPRVSLTTQPSPSSFPSSQKSS